MVSIVTELFLNYIWGGYSLLGKQGYTLPTPARCKRCGGVTSLACDACGAPVCTEHSRITRDMARLCLSCLAAKAEVRHA